MYRNSHDTLNVTVYFRVFDVDDPFDQIHGPDAVNNPGPASVIADVNFIDNDLVGCVGSTCDNRGTTTGLGNSPVFTDANGEARITITVSMQPGDNYRAAASVISEAVQTQIDQTNADALSATQVTNTDGTQYWKANGGFTGYQVPTVWRKLHVETDTMVRPTFPQNTFTMNWTMPRQGPAQTQVVFEVDDPPIGIDLTDDQQFTNGWVELVSASGNTILTNKILVYKQLGLIDSFTNDEVTINIPGCGNGQSGIACLAGNTSGTAILSDDDLSVQATFTAKTWGSDDLYAGPVASLLPPDLTALQLRYHPAYIDPVRDIPSSAVQGLVTFLRNWQESQDSGKALWDQCLAARNLGVSTSNYWSVMVVSAWQAEEAEDEDPNLEGLTGGVNTHVAGKTMSFIGMAYTGISAIFKAVKQAGANESAIPEAFTVAHEIGHTLGLPHNDPDDGQAPVSPIGLMDEMGNGHNLPFVAASLNRLRDYNGP